MTRRTLKKTMRRAYRVLLLVLGIALATKLVEHVPVLAESWLQPIATDVYEYLKDMALVFVTVVAAYLANVFQKRSKFVESLEEEWRGIVKTKSALYAYCEKPYPSADDYLAAFSRISETIDNMRIVYRNAGETKGLVGLYPYEPLHDMRRAIESLDPRQKPNTSANERKLVQSGVLQCFNALRENFLEELDLEEPAYPLLTVAARRMKRNGARYRAEMEEERQTRRFGKQSSPQPEVDSLLRRLRDAERISGDGRLSSSADTIQAPQARGRDV